jgi:hypothetical protein
MSRFRTVDHVHTIIICTFRSLVNGHVALLPVLHSPSSTCCGFFFSRAPFSFFSLSGRNFFQEKSSSKEKKKKRKKEKKKKKETPHKQETHR